MFERYLGDGYWRWDQISVWCHELARAMPDWVGLDEMGRSRHGRPILLLTIGARGSADPMERPAFWLDGGTHAAEWAGVMGALFAASAWADALAAGQRDAQRWFREHTAFIVPCISPDGYEALHGGAPFLRSTLRPPPEGAPRAGLDPCDLDGDGAVRWMRWRHPAGPFVPDEEVPLMMRPRRLDDDPADACFVCSEGTFVQWDGVAWTEAPREFGLDLNRNFPSHWAPFEMFGMDGGRYPLSEPESRAVVDALAARPHVAAAVTNHTYTGCLLTQPYRADTPISDQDVGLMKRLADDAVRDTPYRVFKVHPQFQYDPKKSIVGVWSDTLSTVFGLPGYTLELWDPFAAAGTKVDDVAGFFRRPDPEILRALFRRFGTEADAVRPWTPFEHPQLGPVEIGGLDYMRTVRNPPVADLATECGHALVVADRVRASLPRVTAHVERVRSGTETVLTLVLENLGFLSTSGLDRGAEVGAAVGVSASLELDGPALVDGPAAVALSHLEGWGAAQGRGGGHALYPSLPTRPQRLRVRWRVTGTGRCVIRWTGGRGGRGELGLSIDP